MNTSSLPAFAALPPLPHCTTRESNYWFEYAWVQQRLGDIGSKLLVNAHRFNTVPPADMDQTVEMAIARLRQFQVAYREEYEMVEFQMSR